MTKTDKYHGTITTDIHYNDQAETEVLYESFDFEGFTISMNPPLDEDAAYVSVTCPSKRYEDLMIVINAKEVVFAHQTGGFGATPEELADAMDFIEAARTMKRLI